MVGRTPHDKLFKRVFKDPRYAAEELREALPEAVVRALDWSTLKREPETHVEQRDADAYSDLVFSARAKSTRVLIYVLFEHQSSNDEHMALRLLGYMVSVWRRFVEKPNNLRKPLPLVLPVLLAHAPGGWKAETRFTALFTQEALALAPWSVPDFEYAVDDLTNLDQDALRERPASDPVRLTLWALRDARRGSAFLATAEGWIEALETLARDPTLRHVTSAIILYLLRVLDDETMAAFHGMLSTRAPVAEGLTMTYAEKLISQGLERGLAEGIRQGKLEGIRQGKREGIRQGDLERAATAVLQVLEARGLAVSDDQRARISACDDVEQLSRWLIAAATADSTADVFER